VPNPLHRLAGWIACEVRDAALLELAAAAPQTSSGGQSTWRVAGRFPTAVNEAPDWQREATPSTKAEVVWRKPWKTGDGGMCVHSRKKSDATPASPVSPSPTFLLHFRNILAVAFRAGLYHRDLHITGGSVPRCVPGLDGDRVDSPGSLRTRFQG